MVRTELNPSLTTAGCRGCTTGAPASGRKDWAPASSCSGLSEKVTLCLGCEILSVVHGVQVEVLFGKVMDPGRWGLAGGSKSPGGRFGIYNLTLLPASFCFVNSLGVSEPLPP